MADEKEVKSLEMRIAAIEDKLSKLHVTEEEMKAYEKVSSLMGAGTPAAGTPAASTALSPQFCVVTRFVFCQVFPPPRTIRACECTCGPCACDPTVFSRGSGGGFGGFGT
jgi:hypothetical protein